MPSSSVLQLQRAVTACSSHSTSSYKPSQAIVSWWWVPVALDTSSIICCSGSSGGGGGGTTTTPVPDHVACYHTRTVGPNQCCSAVVQTINAPVSTVWSIVRRFDNPQAYKHFLKSCQVIQGDGSTVGTLRLVHVVSGLPAESSTERLEILDDERHVLSFSVIGGEHRLTNYRSVTTLHASPSGKGTVVIESYVVDIPPGNTKEDTCSFLDTIVRYNLQSLSQIAENMARNKHLPSSSSSP